MNLTVRAALVAIAVALPIGMQFVACTDADPALDTEYIGEAEQAVQEFDGGLRVPNYAVAPLPSPDTPEDHGHLLFLRDGGVFADGGQPDGATFGIPTGLYVVNNTNKWSHIESNSRVYNVLDYGAEPDNGFVDNGPRIQTAINAAAAGALEDNSSMGGAGGSIIYLPTGEYHISSGIVIPRLVNDKSLLFRGAGVGATQLTGAWHCPEDGGSCTGLPSSMPVLSIENAERSAVGYEFSDFTIVRGNEGSALRADCETTSQACRLRQAHFRNMRFGVPFNSNDYHALDIKRAQATTFENIAASGGHASFRLADSSACTISNFQQGTILGGLAMAHHGLWIHGGSTHSLNAIRIEAADYSGLLLDETNGITVDTFSTEGKNIRFQLKVAGAENSFYKATHDVTISNMALAPPCQTTALCAEYCDGLPGCDGSFVARYGLHVNGHSRHIRVLSGFATGWGGNPGSWTPGNPIFIESGAENVSIEHMTLYHGVGAVHPLEGTGGWMQIDSGAKLIRVSAVDGSPGASQFESSEPWERQFNNVGALTGSVIGNHVGFVYGYDVLKTDTGGQLCRLVQGTRATSYGSAGWLDALPSTGRVITIMGTGTGASASLCDSLASGSNCTYCPPGGNVSLAMGSGTWPGTAGTTITLVFDGSRWREISRSATTAP